MSQPKDIIRLRHMRDYSNEPVGLILGRVRKDLDSDRLLSLGLVRLLEIIGEAANRVSSEYKSSNPSIPWSQIVSLRNRLIHGYDAVDMDILWQILKKDLPILIEQLNRTLSKEADH